MVNGKIFAIIITAALINFGINAGYAIASSTFNGNDFALSYSESKNDNERRSLLEEVGRRPHLFRYLQIVEMNEIEKSGRKQVVITALEPASGLDVSFIVNQRVSLSKLQEVPVSEPGSALAVSGVIKGVDNQNGTIVLDPVIVRHKDRLAPKVGKELYVELDSSGIFYSVMSDTDSIQLHFRDRDLLRHRSRVMLQDGEQAWIDFLRTEVNRREEARKAVGEKP